MNASPDPRLDEFFVRYWDDALNAVEAAELAALLAGDPAARAWFQFLTAQAVASAELAPAPVAERAPARRWSRRKVLAAVGGGLAAGIGALALGRWAWSDPTGPTELAEKVRLRGIQGTVVVRAADGSALPAWGGTVPTGATVATEGFGSTAVLAFPDGSTVSLLNDSAITIHESGRVLMLRQGMASANLLARPDDRRLTLTTALLTLVHADAASLTVGQRSRATEVEVHHGAVSVNKPTGEPMTVVREGQLLTVASNGARTQETPGATPDEFAWDLSRPGDGWVVGRHEVADGTPVMCCEAWPDPYYKHAVMHQIRSDNFWARGLFRLEADSVVHVRYRAKGASPKGQVCFCVRTPQSPCSDTGMVEYNGGFEACAPGEWRELRVRAGDMLDNKHAPKFGAPWIGFLVVFNTFEPDVGLEIAEFRVAPPGK